MPSVEFTEAPKPDPRTPVPTVHVSDRVWAAEVAGPHEAPVALRAKTQHAERLAAVGIIDTPQPPTWAENLISRPHPSLHAAVRAYGKWWARHRLDPPEPQRFR